MNWSAFFSMGGYAFYVWGSYLVSLVAIGSEVVLLWRRSQSLKQADMSFRETNRNEKTS
jgi:heme exporter protein D